VPYAVDPRWHQLNHAAGLSGEDVGLNRFEPRHFYLLGGQLAGAPRGDGVSVATAVRARVTRGLPGQSLPTLLRILNAGYHPTRLRMTGPGGAPAAILDVIAHDGRQFRDTSVAGAGSPPLRDPNPPVRAVGRPIITSTLGFGAAERYEMLLVPEVAGTYRLHIDWLHWVTGEQLATRSIPVAVT